MAKATSLIDIKVTPLLTGKSSLANGMAAMAAKEL
jgi:hypothetical protein